MKNTERTVPVFPRKPFFGILLVCACILLLIVTFCVYGNIRSPQTPDEPMLREPATVSASTPLPLYILQEYGQKIGIFERGATTPFQILDVYVFTLPLADQEALETGIRVYSRDALRARIEDFTG